MGYKVNVPLVGGGTRKFEVIDSAGNLVIDEIHTSQGVTVNSPYVLGRTSGYISSGFGPSSTNIIEKFPFSSDGNATDVGNLTRSTSEYAAGNSSDTHGYTAGGTNGISNIIDKFPFSADANATDVGDLLFVAYSLASASSETHGYAAGGITNPSSTPVNTIQKYTFSVDANATDVGDLSYATYRYVQGNQSENTGYVMNTGYPLAGYPFGYLEKYPFASDDNGTIISSSGLTNSLRIGVSAQSSADHGYFSGGQVSGSPSTKVDIIEKFPFSNEANATDVGNLTAGVGWCSGTMSVDHGYVNGGSKPSPPRSNVIEKYPFASDANATDVGDMQSERSSPTNQEV